MLTDAQLAILKSAILTDTDPNVVAALAIRNDVELARLYNLPSAFICWRTDTLKTDIFGALDWKNFTPADVPDNSVIWTNRALACQSKQFNIQTILISPGDTLDMSKPNIRNGLKDAIQNIPAGVAGALLDAGWVNVKNAGTRAATKAEALYTTGLGTASNPGNFTYEGNLYVDTVSIALNT